MSVERRSRARVAVQIPCTLSGPGGTVDAEIHDISAVGARVRSASLVASDYEGLEVRVEPAGAHEGLRVRARVMYHRERDGGFLAGIQFVDLDAAAHRALTAFLRAVLGGAGGGAREHPRVSRRVEVACRTKKGARAMLQDISRGGVRVTLEDGSVAPGEVLEIALTVGRLDRPLELRGEVVRTKRLEGGGCQAGVRLAPLSPEAEALLSRLLQVLVGAGA